jgi:hypothetical protein
MPHKFNALTQNIHTLRLSVGGHTHGWTDRCTENIYSIFRDKLLLLGEHIYHEKAISQYMPGWHMAWDEIQKEGNPTKSQAINDLIKDIERHEVRGMGIATAAHHPIEWDVYIMLLLAVRQLFSHRKKAMYMILAVMMLQWHLLAELTILCVWPR